MAFRRLIARSAINPPDTTPPSDIVTLASFAVTETTITVTFSPATDNRSVSGYELRVDDSVSPYITGPFSGSPITATGLTQGVEYDIQVRAFDQAGNRGNWSNIVTETTTAVSGTKKWNPGKYIRPDAFGYHTKDAQRLATYDKALPHSEIKGCEVPVNWGRIEPNQGSYDWSSVEADINRITANRTNGKKVILALMFQNYGAAGIPSTPQSQTGAVIIPDYVITNGWCAIRTGSGLMPKLDIADCMTRLIAFAQACAAQYDNDSYVEMVIISETSSAYTGMNAGNYSTQWHRMPAALAAAFSHTWAGVGHNGLTSETHSKTMADLIVANGCAHGTEDIIGWYGDTWPAPTTGDAQGGWGFLAIKGAGVVDGFNWGSTDSRSSVAIRPENQVIRSPGLTLAQILSYSNTNWYGTHPVFVARFGADGSSYVPRDYVDLVDVPAQSGTNVISFLANAANTVTRSAYPS